MGDFFYALGDFFTETLKLVPALGNGPNILFLLIGFGGFFYWLGQMRKHKKAGEH